MQTTFILVQLPLDLGKFSVTSKWNHLSKRCPSDWEHWVHSLGFVAFWQIPHLIKTFWSNKWSAIIAASKKKKKKKSRWSISYNFTINNEQCLLGTWSRTLFFFSSESICEADKYQKRKGRRVYQAWFSINDFGLYLSKAISDNTRKYLLQ